MIKPALLVAMSLALIAAAPDPLEGLWGGDHLVMTVHDGQADLKMDCGAGAITSPPTLHDDGSFTAKGWFQRYRPGPQRADEAPSANAARYEGRVDGTMMSLTITMVDQSQEAPLTFTLERGKQVKLIRCM